MDVFRNAVLVFASWVATSACSAQPWTKAEELPLDFFQDRSECITVWDEIFEEWVAHGGGVAESVAATRARIQADRNTRLSALVRRSWEYQSENFPASALEPFSWPVPTSLSRQIDQSVSFLDSDRVPESCQARFYLEDWLASDLLSEDRAAHRKLKETPPEMDWESPHVQQWLGFWILFRVDES